MTISYDDNNIFARILRGEIPCAKVYEDAHTLAFQDIHPQAPQHFQAVHAVHLEVGDHQIENLFLDLRNRLFTVRRHGHGVSRPLQHDAQHIPQALLIIDD